VPEHIEIQLALRARAIAVSVCTTGLTNLSATVAGYQRAAGSFITDGFEVGMEVTPAGFVQTAPGVITEVTDTDLTIDDGATVEAAAGSRSLVVGLPSRRGWENERFEATPGKPYVHEDYVPGSSTLRGLTSGGTVEDTGLYILRWYGLANQGIRSLSRCADQLLKYFAPGTPMPITDGTIIARGDTAVRRSQQLPAAEGWSLIAITIPWRLYTLNALVP